jgi:hypothetical protein
MKESQSVKEGGRVDACSDSMFDKFCKKEFDKINSKLDNIDKALRGNGTPGIQVRLDRLEQVKHNTSRVYWLLIGCVVTATSSVAVALIVSRIVK